MSAFVLDCSVAVSWLFEDEARTETDALQPQLAASGGCVPALWLLEVANVLMQAERRGRIDAAGADERFDLLESLPLLVDTEHSASVIRQVIRLARAYSLTSYDAAYLELALRRRLPLATLDKAMRAAAQTEGVTCLPADIQA